jgi:membrane protease YdiL (CAAX protease family)
MKMLASLFRGPVAYVPRSGWPGWAVLLATAGIFVLAVIIGTLAGLGYYYYALAGGEVAQQGSTGLPVPQMPFAVGLAVLQICTILFTIAAAGLYQSERKAVLALVPPSDGWRILPWALLPLFVVSGVWTAIVLYLQPDLLINDTKPIQQLIQSDALWLVLLVICIGAPVSEELLFRGFLFSGLSKTWLGFIGTAVVTSLLWTSLHAGYSIFGLVEVLAMGLYFSWLLVRTGSVWVPIFCHAANNTLACVVLYFVTLPS